MFIRKSTSSRGGGGAGTRWFKNKVHIVRTVFFFVYIIMLRIFFFFYIIAFDEYFDICQNVYLQYKTTGRNKEIRTRTAEKHVLLMFENTFIGFRNSLDFFKTYKSHYASSIFNLKIRAQWWNTRVSYYVHLMSIFKYLSVKSVHVSSFQ